MWFKRRLRPTVTLWLRAQSAGRRRASVRVRTVSIPVARVSTPPGSPQNLPGPPPSRKQFPPHQPPEMASPGWPPPPGQPPDPAVLKVTHTEPSSTQPPARPTPSGTDALRRTPTGANLGSVTPLAFKGPVSLEMMLLFPSNCTVKSRFTVLPTAIRRALLVVAC